MIETKLREHSKEKCFYHQLTIHEKINAKGNSQIVHPAWGNQISLERSKGKHGWDCQRIDWELVYWQRKNHHVADPDKRHKKTLF